jgi:hypothetical protein
MVWNRAQIVFSELADALGGGSTEALQERMLELDTDGNGGPLASKPTHIHTHTHTYIHIHTHTYTYTHIHTHTHTYIHIHTHTYT